MPLDRGREPVQRASIESISRLLFRVALIALLAVLAWKLADVLLLAFASILVALLLRSLADLVENYLQIRGNWSLVIAGLFVLAVIVIFVWVLGSQIWAQALELIQRIPVMLRSVEERLGLANLEGWLAERARDLLDDGLFSQVAGYTSLVIGIAGHLFLVLVAGVYLAIRPNFYRVGFLKLIPPESRGEAGETLSAVSRALRLWLLGQLAAMVLVGSLTGAGLWLLGIPSALALGLLAGLAEFVPLVGPIIGAIPAVLLALSQDTTLALWVIGLYLLIQQIEGNLITPLVQQHAVDLPPAMTILAIVAFGVLFGSLGVILATPLAAVALVGVKKLWVRDTLEEPTELPGETAEEAQDQLTR